MAWSPDDTRLASVGAGGGCYQWDVSGGVKIAHEEYVDKQKNYCCVQFCSSNSSMYGVVVRSLDGKIQHIQVWAAATAPCLHSAIPALQLSFCLCADIAGLYLQSDWQLDNLSKNCYNDASIFPCCKLWCFCHGQHCDFTLFNDLVSM